MNKSVPGWLAEAVFYEIYPQSFLDTNGDGIGDLKGIQCKLDYIQSLGCNVIWLNPCFDSPFGDAGYDVRDYRKIAARYGTNEDMKRLIRDCHKRGMRICLDFVPGHTSSEHPWFKESSKPEANKYSNWYVWTDSVWSGDPDLKTINGYSGRNAQYVTNFFWFQPALNYGFAKPDPAKRWQLPVNHPDVLALKREMLDIMSFWLEMGVDGFRVDMAASLVKGDVDGKAMRRHWAGVRQWMKKRYPEAMLIAEWSDPCKAIPAGFHVDFMIHFGTPAYTSLFRAERERSTLPCAEPGHSFFDRKGKGDIQIFMEHYWKAYEKTRRKGYISLPTSNHDITRLNAGRSMPELKVAMAFLLTMPGVPTVYYGDEIGMRYIAGLPDKEGGYERTGSRTPMQWNENKNNGFSTAKAGCLYTPCDESTSRPTVESQEKDPGSLLNLVRTLLKLRKATPSLGNLGGFRPVYAEKGRYPFVYERFAGRKRYVVAVNPAARQMVVPLPYRSGLTMLLGHGVCHDKQKLAMKGSSFGIFELKK